MKKQIIGLAVVVVVATVGILGWRYVRGAPDQRVVVHGNVDIRQVSLAFDGSGRIALLMVEEGQRVKAGDTLAVLDTRTLRLQLDQAQGQEEAQLQTLLRLQHGSRPEEIKQAQSRLRAAQADASRADQDLARLQSIAAMTQGRGVSAQDLDKAQSAAQANKAKVDELQDALRLAELGPRAEEVANAQAMLKAAKAQVALLMHEIAQGELKAPADAVVRSRLLEPGDMATPQRPVFALALTQPKWVRVYVSESDLGRIKPGMAARVWTDSQPDKPWTGHIGYISSVAEFTPKSVQTEELRTSLVYEVRVLVDDPRDDLRLGQPATVQLMVGAAV